jgi:hypothetical protein
MRPFSFMSYAEPFHSCPPKGHGQTRRGVVVTAALALTRLVNGTL